MLAHPRRCQNCAADAARGSIARDRKSCHLGGHNTRRRLSLKRMQIIANGQRKRPRQAPIDAEWKKPAEYEEGDGGVAGVDSTGGGLIVSDNSLNDGANELRTTTRHLGTEQNLSGYRRSVSAETQNKSSTPGDTAKYFSVGSFWSDNGEIAASCSHFSFILPRWFVPLFPLQQS
uniref:Uncharacterized protein n=1 Tax=Plectus sambesii TaxID=2011161 RepID=A0A914VBN4_9BILA